MKSKITFSCTCRPFGPLFIANAHILRHFSVCCVSLSGEISSFVRNFVTFRWHGVLRKRYTIYLSVSVWMSTKQVWDGKSWVVVKHSNLIQKEYHTLPCGLLSFVRVHFTNFQACALTFMRYFQRRKVVTVMSLNECSKYILRKKVTRFFKFAEPFKSLVKSFVTTL